MASNDNSNKYWKWEKVECGATAITFTYPVGVTPEQVMTRLDKMYPGPQYEYQGWEGIRQFVVICKYHDDDDSAAEDSEDDD